VATFHRKERGLPVEKSFFTENLFTISILLQFAAKIIFCVISLKSALNVQQAHLRQISVFCLEAAFWPK
jgi:hypothetical protein